jgi:hypothetical protein
VAKNREDEALEALGASTVVGKITFFAKSQFWAEDGGGMWKLYMLFFNNFLPKSYRIAYNNKLTLH